MIKFRLSIVQKICLAGILIPLVAIFQKIFAINYIPVIPFLRISFGGPALIMFASILLGPWFGLLVGAASDLIGFFMFDPKMFGAVPFFQITAIYGLLGFSTYYVFKLVSLIKSTKIMLITSIVTSLLLLAGVTAYINVVDSISLYGAVYKFTTLHRVLVPIILFILLVILALVVYYMNKYFRKRDINLSVIHISYASFILELFVMLIFGTIMKTWAFSSTTFIAIFISQLAVFFFNIPLNTFLLSTLMNVSKRLFRSEKV